AHALVWTAERGPIHAPIQWRSSRPAVVAVRVVSDSTVDLLYRRRGRAVLTAAAAGTAAWVILYVGLIPATTSIRVSPAEAVLQPGDFVRLQALPYDSRRRLKPALWVQWAWTDSTRVRFVGIPAEG